MACGQLLGGKLGSQLVILNGAKLVRPIFLTIVFFTILVMFCKSYVGLGNVMRLVNVFGVVPAVIFFVVAVASVALINFWDGKRREHNI